MQGGWIGMILSVDLTQKTTATENLDPDLARKYIGGTGLGMKYVYDEVLPGVDAFDPENPLVFATGPMTGTAALGSGACAIVTKSPLTGFTAAMGTMNGLFGAKLKFAGYDAVIIRGESEKPVYLWIEDGKAELKDAARIWGTNANEAEGLIKAELEEARASVACIGIAGENLVRYASVYSDAGHIASSGGLGAVMGAKKLKAIAVHGTGKVPIANKEEFNSAVSRWHEVAENSPLSTMLRNFGTGGMLATIHQLGDLPTKNLTTSVFPEHENLTGQYIRSNFPTKVKHSCYRCPINHVHTFEINEGPYKGLVGEEPEYEAIAAWGSNVGISDTAAVLYICNLTDWLGMDCKTATFIVSLCMECYEKGILSKDDLGGIDLTWGNAEGVIALLEKIARREGIGNILAEGTRRAAEYIGGEAPKFAVHVKGAGIHVHDFRAIWGYGFSHIISSFAATKEGLGAELVPDPDLGYTEALNRLGREGHAEAAKKTGNKDLFCDCAVICNFVVRGLPQATVIEALNAITGEEFTVEGIYTTMEKVRCLARAFAIRHGLTPDDDWPSERLLEAPKDGGAAGHTWRPYLKGMVTEYYRLMGWDEKTSKPLRRTLKKLDLDFVIKDIWQ